MRKCEYGKDCDFERFSRGEITEDGACVELCMEHYKSVVRNHYNLSARSAMKWIVNYRVDIIHIGEKYITLDLTALDKEPRLLVCAIDLPRYAAAANTFEIGQQFKLTLEKA